MQPVGVVGMGTSTASAACATSIGVSPSSSAKGASVTYSAVVVGGSSKPTGSVSFRVPGLVAYTARLSGCSGSCSSAGAPVGDDDVIGTYIGDATHSGSSGKTMLTVEVGASSTSVSVSLTAVTYGTSVTYSAVVTGGSATPTGSVAFTVAGVAACTAMLSGGSGSCSSASAPVGNDDNVFGSFSGDSTYSASSGDASLTVDSPGLSATMISVGVSSTVVSHGTSVAYSATVGGGPTTPTGSVLFTVGGDSACSATLTNGSGSCSSGVAPVGNDNVIATYGGDVTHAASAGNASLTVSANSDVASKSGSVPSRCQVWKRDTRAQECAR